MSFGVEYHLKSLRTYSNIDQFNNKHESVACLPSWSSSLVLSTFDHAYPKLWIRLIQWKCVDRSSTIDPFVSSSARSAVNRELVFEFEAGNRYYRYLEDLSVRSASSMELSINDRFESPPSLNGQPESSRWSSNGLPTLNGNLRVGRVKDEQFEFFNNSPWLVEIFTTAVPDLIFDQTKAGSSSKNVHLSLIMHEANLRLTTRFFSYGKKFDVNQWRRSGTLNCGVDKFPLLVRVD